MGIRQWEKSDLVPRKDDVFQERLYCIRWRRPDGTRVYRAPTAFDLMNEQQALALVTARLETWWAQGFLPSRRIEPGYNTDQPGRERG